MKIKKNQIIKDEVEKKTNEQTKNIGILNPTILFSKLGKKATPTIVTCISLMAHL